MSLPPLPPKRPREQQPRAPEPERAPTPTAASSAVPRCAVTTGAHQGKLHEYDIQMMATLDGRPVKGAPKEKTYICEGHYPDKDDPTFATCDCRLCQIRRRPA